MTLKDTMDKLSTEQVKRLAKRELSRKNDKLLDVIINIAKQNRNEFAEEMDEYMRRHYQLGHIHFRKMKRMASLGFLPHKFEKFNDNYKCKIRMFGKQHRTRHRVKGEKKEIFKSSYLG